MPRSRSSSFESITRSTWCSLERNVPLCCSMASTSVVLPWSTCAMIAMLRMPKLKKDPSRNMVYYYFTMRRVKRPRIAWVQCGRSSDGSMILFGNCGLDEFCTHVRTALRAHAQPVPDHNCHQRKHEDDGRDRVDLRRDPAPEASPDFQRERVVASNQKETDRDFVHGEREDQKRRADDRQL